MEKWQLKRAMIAAIEAGAGEQMRTITGEVLSAPYSETLWQWLTTIAKVQPAVAAGQIFLTINKRTAKAVGINP